MDEIMFGQQRTSVTDQFTPSPAIWGSPGFNIRKLLSNPSLGIYFYDNFVDLTLTPTLTTQIGFGAYKAYAASGCNITRVSAINSVEVMGGALQISMDTDNDEASIGLPYASFLMSGLASNSGKLAFECCYTQNSIATNMASTFFGLGETDAFTFGANVPHNSGDAIDASGSMIGFRIEEDGLGVVDTVYSDRATSFTNIGDTEAGTITAHTFRKYGFLYDPTRSADCVRFFIDNVQCTTPLTRAALVALTNLDANSLAPMWSVAADSAGTSFLGSMKWWRVAQYYPGQTP